MNNPRRDTVEFGYDKWELVALEKTDPFPTAYDKWFYLLTQNRIMFVPQTVAQKIGTLDPQAGEEFYIRKYKIWAGKKSRTEWDVSQQPGMLDPDTGIPESDLTRQLRESRELAKKAGARNQAKLNVERKHDAELPAVATAARHSVEADVPRLHPQASSLVEGCLALDSPKKEPAMAQTPIARPGWYTALVSQTKDLVDALAEVRLHAEKHGQRVSFDDCEKLLVTSLIGKQRQRA